MLPRSSPRGLGPVAVLVLFLASCGSGSGEPCTTDDDCASGYCLEVSCPAKGTRNRVCAGNECGEVCPVLEQCVEFDNTRAFCVHSNACQ